MTVVNLSEFICCVYTALLKNYPLMHVWVVTLYVKQKKVTVLIFDKLQKFELPPDAQM